MAKANKALNEIDQFIEKAMKKLKVEKAPKFAATCLMELGACITSNLIK